MQELYADIPEITRLIIDYWIDVAKNETDIVRASQILFDCRDGLPTEYEKEFFDFCVNVAFLNVDKQVEK